MVGLGSDPVFQEHTDRTQHPECPERLAAILQALDERGLAPLLQPVPRRVATGEELERVHSPEHVQRVHDIAGRWGYLDPDTFFSPHSTEAALVAAGSAIQAVEEVLDGRMDSAFCAVRPPGHHAERGRGMGFCLFNNVAMAAAHALEAGLERVLVFDWDVHHGNGTQHIFEEDPRVLFVSIHQYPFYPGTGHHTEFGKGAGSGRTCNFPMPRGMGDVDYLAVWSELAGRIITSFDPELVLISAGFDALYSDPLGSMRLTEAGFGHLADRLLGLGKPTVALLEGGYDTEGSAGCVARVVERMLMREGSLPHVPLPDVDPSPHPSRAQVLSAVRDSLCPFWCGAI